MVMHDILGFLSEESLDKINVLQIILLNKNNFLTEKMLCEKLGLSLFKFKKAVEVLNQELRYFDETPIISTEQNEGIICDSLSEEIIRILKLNYLEQSVTYQLFLELISQPISIDKFVKKAFISLSYGYKVKKELTRILKKSSIVYKKNKIEGDERQIRSFIFEVFYYYYNGIKFPLGPNVEREVEILNELIVCVISKSLPYTRQIKLKLFLLVQYIRINESNYLIGLKTNCTGLKNKGLSDFRRYIKNHFSLGGNVLDYETEYTQMFVTLHDIAADSEVYENNPLEIDTHSPTFLNYFKEYFSLEKTLKMGAVWVNDLSRELGKIMNKIMFFPISSTTFTSDEQLDYFKECYPHFHMFIESFLKMDGTLESTLLLDEKNKLYYDYMFALIAYVPADLVEKPLYVCVDFSHGETYSKFIRSHVDAFRNLNLILEETLSTKTNLYISDFYLSKLNCEQLIWKNPPSSDDWEDFGNIIVNLKGV